MKKIICVFLFVMLFGFNVSVVRALASNEELLNAIKNEEIYKALVSENNAGEVVINDDKLIYNYNVNNTSYTTTFVLTDEDITLVNSSETMNEKIIDGFFVSSVIRSVASLNGNTKDEIDNLNVTELNNYNYIDNGIELKTTTKKVEEETEYGHSTVTYEEIESFRIKRDFKIISTSDEKDTRVVNGVINNNVLTITGDYSNGDECSVYVSDEADALFYTRYKTIACNNLVDLSEFNDKTYYFKVAISTSNAWSSSITYNYVSNTSVVKESVIEESIKEGEVENPDTGFKAPIREILLFLGLSLGVFFISRKKYLRRL